MNLLPLYVGMGAVWLDRVSNRWKRATIAGVGMLLMVFMLPPMYGEGFGIISNLVNGFDYVLKFCNRINAAEETKQNDPSEIGDIGRHGMPRTLTLTILHPI